MIKVKIYYKWIGATQTRWFEKSEEAQEWVDKMKIENKDIATILAIDTKIVIHEHLSWTGEGYSGYSGFCGCWTRE